MRVWCGGQWRGERHGEVNHSHFSPSGDGKKAW